MADLPLTRLESWRLKQGLTYSELGARLGVTQQAAHRYCRPPGDASHRRPARSVALLLAAITDGEIDIANYSDRVSTSSGDIERAMGVA